MNKIKTIYLNTVTLVAELAIIVLSLLMVLLVVLCYAVAPPDRHIEPWDFTVWLEEKRKKILNKYEL